MILLKILNEKMKKVLFILFLLFLCFGAASVKAQVRIGGNAAPQGAAVLDLNADNSGTPAGNKGALALPRVRLDSATVLLNGTTPITGMLVWNTNATLGVGIYYWSGTAWAQTNLPVTSPADSGLVLLFNGRNWVKGNAILASSYIDTILITPRDVGPVTWSKVLDTTVTWHYTGRNPTVIPATWLRQSDFCNMNAGAAYNFRWFDNYISIMVMTNRLPGVATNRFVCYRPSI